MKNLSLARPYAKAAYLYAKEHLQVEPWFDFLGELGVLFADINMLKLIKNPKLSRAVLLETLTSALKHKPTVPMLHFLQQLAEKNRLELLPEIVELFARDWQKDRTVREVEITATQKLSDKQLAELQTSLTHQFKQPVFIEVVIDERLIGGLIIRSGDYVMDGSLRGQLKRLKHTLMQ
jgi:F-type H+-transporting ATPase subunit delta